MYTSSVTSHASSHCSCTHREASGKGIEKFIAYEVPLALAQERYGGHFQVAMQDLHNPTIFVFSISTASGHFASFGLKSSPHP